MGEKHEDGALDKIIQASQARLIQNTENLLQDDLSIALRLGPAMDYLSNIMAEAQKAYEAELPFVKALETFSNYIAESIALYPAPEVLEKRKEGLIESYKAWGKFGWSWIGHTPIKFYEAMPTNIADANKRIKPYCTDEIMGTLFVSLHTKSTEQTDLDSAIFCYENRQYKPCAMVLFGMIDAKLITHQQAKDNRSVGGKAVRKLRTQFEAENDNREFYTMLRYINLFSCLETIFRHAGNFKCEPPTINRNFIDHGMNQRPVCRLDCIQLFFVLDNLIDFFEEDWGYSAKKHTSN